MFKSFNISIYLLVLALLLIIFAPVFAHAASINLTCSLPTAREDGTALAASELSKMEVYLGSVTTGPIAVYPVDNCSYTYPVAKGNCVKAGDPIGLKVVDTGGIKSMLSNTIVLSADACTPKAAPGIPGNVKATVTP